MADIKEITTIEINFTHAGNKNVGLFSKLNRQGETLTRHASIIYGHNGAGKSTISRELQRFSEAEANLNFYNKNNDLLDLGTKRDRFFIFNEDFVDQNVRSVEDSGLRPIILVGDKAKIQNEIDILQKELDEVISDLNNNKTEIDEIVEGKRKKESELEKFIKSTWKSRSARYNDKPREKNFINATTGTKIKSHYGNKEDVDNLKKIFDSITHRIQLTAGKSEVNWEEEAPSLSIDIKKINEFLKSTPSSKDAEFSELGTLISQNTIGELNEKINGIFSKGSSHCHECFQEISDKYKSWITKEINNYIANVNSIDYSSVAEKLKTDTLDIPALPNNLFIDEITKENFNQAFHNVNDFIKKINNLLYRKAEAPFENFEIDLVDLAALEKSLQDSFENIRALVGQHNQAVSNFRELQSEADDLNCKITALEANFLLEAIESDKKKIAELSPNWIKLQSKKESLNEEMESLRSNFQNTNLATEYINRLLKIALGNDAMQLRPSGNSYEVFNRNCSVSPHHLSTGEKNILALCYFIVNMSHGSSIFNDEEKFIVFDDPISSLDYDNKYGIISLLNFFVNKLFRNNKDSKLAILTHDLGAVQDLKNILDKNGLNIDTALLELRSGNLSEFNVSNDLYLDILKRIFNIITSDKQENLQEIVSHNEIRRLWEAYTTFELGEKITTANVSDFVKDFVSDSDSNFEDFINRFSCHAFINTDSHSAFQIKSFNYSLQPVIGDREFLRYLEDILCFMYVISPNHIISRLGNRNDYERIKSELDSIKSRVLEITRY